MVKVLFEDNIKSFPYQLLGRLPNVTVEGSKGATRIKNMLPELRPTTVVFMDVTADKPSTIHRYNELVDEISSMSGVYIVPIPCIEYYIIRAFFGYCSIEYETALTFGNYKCITKSFNKLSTNTHNYEKYCKSIVHNYNRCFRDDTFVTQDCSCLNRFDGCFDLSLKEKTSRLLLSLPVYLLDTDDIAIKKGIEISEALYDIMSAEFLKNGVITSNHLHTIHKQKF